MSKFERSVGGRITVSLALVVVLGTFVVAAPVSATSGPVTLVQVESLVAAGVQIKATPTLSATVPPLLKITQADASLSPIRQNCYARSSSTVTTVVADAATECAYGDTTKSRVILLTGDSQAGMWLPAFNQLGIDLGWKIVFLAHPQCPPWGVPNKPAWIIQGQFNVADCTAYQANIAKWVAINLPAVVVLVGRAHPVGANANAPLVLSELQPRITATIKSMQHPSTTVINLTPLPSYTANWTAYTPATCLAYIKPITNCEGKPGQMISPVELLAEQNSAKTDGSVLVNVWHLFCTSSRCALFVKDSSTYRLVYSDALHMNSHYSAWIANAFETLIGPSLPK